MIPYFKQDYMIEAFSETLLGLGICRYTSRKIPCIFDIKSRRNKSPRAFCSSGQNSRGRYLVVMPSGGQE
ncbi:MAG: hypothetical protein U5N58_07760 [Actinomycetota bacterium]|nr:hypothetical protein [Actinomycetota bacterium]